MKLKLDKPTKMWANTDKDELRCTEYAPVYDSRAAALDERLDGEITERVLVTVTRIDKRRKQA